MKKFIRESREKVCFNMSKHFSEFYKFLEPKSYIKRMRKFPREAREKFSYEELCGILPLAEAIYKLNLSLKNKSSKNA